MSEIILYITDDSLTKINVKLENETVWLTIDQMAELFNKSRSTINEHILNIYNENELVEKDTMRKIGIFDFSTKPTNYYNPDLAELNAIEEREMRMADYMRELDSILGSTGRKVLDNAGKIWHTQATEKAKLEYKKYKAQTLLSVEKEYLKTLSDLEKKAKKK
jgi:hypothetical protein